MTPNLGRQHTRHSYVLGSKTSQRSTKCGYWWMSNTRPTNAGACFQDCDRPLSRKSLGKEKTPRKERMARMARMAKMARMARMARMRRQGNVEFQLPYLARIMSPGPPWQWFSKPIMLLRESDSLHRQYISIPGSTSLRFHQHHPSGTTLIPRGGITSHPNS